MAIEVARDVIAALLAEAKAAHPRECCGILLGHQQTLTASLPAANVHPAPETHFEIDPQTLIDAHRAARTGGPEVVGYYHSHPVGKAEPSAVDAEHASADGRIWAIIGEGGVRFWRDLAEGFAPLSYQILD